GIALEEVDDHLLADAGDVHGPPAGPGPVLRDADEAGLLLVLVVGILGRAAHLAAPVPVELHQHPPLLVGADLLVGGLVAPAHHGGGLRALHARPGRLARVAVLAAQIDEAIAGSVLGLARGDAGGLV